MWPVHVVLRDTLRKHNSNNNNSNSSNNIINNYYCYYYYHHQQQLKQQQQHQTQSFHLRSFIVHVFRCLLFSRPPLLPPLRPPCAPGPLRAAPLPRQVSCQEHRYIWAVCGAVEGAESCPLQGVVKIDTQTGTSEQWIPEAHEFLGEVRGRDAEGEKRGAGREDQ